MHATTPRSRPRRPSLRKAPEIDPLSTSQNNRNLGSANTRLESNKYSLAHNELVEELTIDICGDSKLQAFPSRTATDSLTSEASKLL